MTATPARKPPPTQPSAGRRRPPRDVAADLDDDLQRRARGDGEEEHAQQVAREKAADPGASDGGRARNQRECREPSERHALALGDRRGDPEPLGDVVNHEADDEEAAERELAERERRADGEPLAEVVQPDADGDERGERDAAERPPSPLAARAEPLRDECQRRGSWPQRRAGRARCRRAARAASPAGRAPPQARRARGTSAGRPSAP